MNLSTILKKKYFDIQKERTYRDAVYRGQSEAIWELTPSLFRDAPNANSIPFNWVREKIIQEYQDVREFVRLADRRGFNLPGDVFTIINIKTLNNTTFYNWYSTQIDDYVELITTAQHHGVSTRFLDFTFDAYVALYFAAEGAIRILLREKDENSNDQFALWMIDSMYLNHCECKPKHFEVPLARNKYLYEQSGLFLRPPLPNTGRESHKSDFNIKEVAINNCLDLGGKYEAFKDLWPVINKLNFPFELAPEIIRELDDRKDINITKLKPNLDHIIPYRSFREKVNNLGQKLKK